MTSLPEQLSAARTQQLDAQFQLFRSLATQALDNASRIVSLNLTTSRESAERTSRAMHQMLGATDPRELAALRTHAEEQMRSLFAYGRELLSIATSAQPQAARTLADAAPAALAAPKAIEPLVERGAEVMKESVQAAGAAVDKAVDSTADTLDKAIAAASPVQEAPVVVAAPEPIKEPEPVATPNPIAKAAGKGAAKAAVAAQPLAAPIKDTSSVTPISGTPSKRKK